MGFLVLSVWLKFLNDMFLFFIIVWILFFVLLVIIIVFFNGMVWFFCSVFNVFESVFFVLCCVIILRVVKIFIFELCKFGLVNILFNLCFICFMNVGCLLLVKLVFDVNFKGIDIYCLYWEWLILFLLNNMCKIKFLCFLMCLG